MSNVMTSIEYFRNFKDVIWNTLDDNLDTRERTRNYERAGNYEPFSLELWRFAAECAYHKLAKSVANDLSNRVTIDAKE